MSRGMGPVQRRILAVLSQGIDGEFVTIELSHLKELVGGDCSNLRRTIRGLLARHMIRERIEGGRRYYELTLPGHVAAVPPDPATAPSLLDYLGLSHKRETPWTTAEGTLRENQKGER